MRGIIALGSDRGVTGWQIRKDRCENMTGTPGAPRTPAEISGRLTLRGLRLFIALEKSGSVAEAAKNLGLSKSNVSQHITTLENSVGTKLFDRRQKPITLTPAGQILGMHAHRIMATVSVAETALAELHLDSLPHLNLAVVDDLDASLTPVLASSLQAQMPRCFICTFSGRSDQVTARLLLREADIAITANIPVEMHKFQVHQLLREKFVLVSAKGTYSRGDDWRTKLSQMPFAQYSDTMPMGQMVSTHLKRIGFHVPRRFSFETNRSVIATVARTGGWTMATPLSILDASRFRGEVDISPLPFPGMSREIYLINRIDEFGPLSEVLAERIRALLREELLPDFARTAPNLLDTLEVYNSTPR